MKILLHFGLLLAMFGAIANTGVAAETIVQIPAHPSKCSVCGAAFLPPPESGVDGDSLNSPEKLFHHYGIHAHLEAYLVCVYQVEKKLGTKLDTIEIKATVVDRIQGKKNLGERISFFRCFDYPLGDVSAMNGALYYVFFTRFENGEVGVDCQAPMAMVDFKESLRKVADQHKILCRPVDRATKG